MKKNKIIFAEFVIIFIIIFIFLIINVTGTMKISTSESKISTKTIEDLDKKGSKVGCLIGSTVYDALLKKFKNAEILLFNTNQDVFESVSSGVTDCGIAYFETVDKVVNEYKNLTYIPDIIYEYQSSFIFPKNNKGKLLQEQFDDFLDNIKNNGEWDRIVNKWDSLDVNNYFIDDMNFTGENGNIKVCTCGSWEPKSFYYNGKIIGLYIELTQMFCKEYGYTPKIYTADYQAELSGISVGQYDMMADIVQITPERENAAYFSGTIYSDKNVLLVHDNEVNIQIVKKSDVFFSNLKKSFEKNFLIDNRWKMLLQGLLVTIMLSILSAFFGTMFGCIICFCRMSGNTFLTAFARLYIKIIQGTPIVVLLMILYYIVFAKLDYSAFNVCVIGFSIDFAAYVSEIFRTGIESVPIGQKKAGYALGFSKIETFFKIVLPQALVHIIPVYSGQFIAMVKMTSVAGYISVYDLTKASDFIRALTYEAFFPLITTAIIYFILANLLISLLKFLEHKVDPKLRKRTLKGVNV